MTEKDLKNTETNGQEKKKKNKMPLSTKLMILAAAMLVISLIIGFYPNIAKSVTGIQQENRINEFNQNIEKARENGKNDGVKYPTDPDAPKAIDDNKYADSKLMNEEQIKTNEEQIRGYDPKLLAKLYADMVKYNRELYENGQIISDPFSYEEESFDLKRYSIYDDIFGYVSAPKINLNLPIYLGASEDNMWRGAVQLTGTSMPIGGINTNTVLAAHRGVVNFEMFDNIVFLEEGDSVFVTNPWYQMEYRVVKSEIINPTQSDKVKIQPGKDMLTLLTCHPYGYTDYRYVVYCERVG